MRFEWDPDKNEKNLKKHGIAFEEACSVFFDDDALLIADPDHSQDEERFLILGYSGLANMLIVGHCYRDSEECIRLISARKATGKETRQYYDRIV